MPQKAREIYGDAATVGDFQLAIRYRYNPDVRSLDAMVPAVIPMLLLLIPSMLAALSVVREKELGSIINFYVTPVTRFEFLLGKQIPYVVLAMLNFLLLTAFAVFIFRVPFTGSFCDLRRRRASLCHRHDGDGPAALDLHEQPDRGDLRNRAHHDHSGRRNIRA